MWPSNRTSWNAETGDVTFESTSGEIVELVDGDAVSFSGGGSSTQEGGLPPNEFLSSIEWASEPAISCVADTRWFVGDYVEPSTDGGADASSGEVPDKAAVEGTGAELITTFETDDEDPLWAVLDYWWYPEEEPRHFTYSTSDEPIAFE